MNETKLWSFKPTKKAGDTVGPGDVIGVVHENNLFTDHKILVPPFDYLTGKLKSIKPAGDYNIV